MRRKLRETTADARAAVEAGDVLVAGAPALNPARLVDAGEPIRLVTPPPFVSRGGEKLQAALDRFAIAVRGRRAIDVGASTGGFTDCLLQHGARSVVALDVGHGHLHERLRADERVTVLERRNVRDLGPGCCTPEARERAVGPPADLLTADLSFISLRVVRDALLALVVPDADLVLLIKPQFEADRAEAAQSGGVITDPAVWQRTATEVLRAFAAAGAGIMDVMVSPRRGAHGNLELLAHLRVPGSDSPPEGGPMTADEFVARALAGHGLEGGAGSWPPSR